MTPPPDLRDDNGLLKSINHPRNPLGGVDWRKMIPPEYLYVSPDHQVEVMTTQNVRSKWDIDVSKCEDKQLLITLAGLKYLARLRGIQSAPAPTVHVSPTEATCVCSIEFVPNFENPDGLVVSGVGCASVYSVTGKFQLYLGTMAHNRAYTRAVRDALGIEILGYEEVDFKASAAFEKQLKEGSNPLIPSPPVAEPQFATSYTPDPLGLLQERCDKGNISFDVLKARAIEYRAELVYAVAMSAGEKMADSFDPVNWKGFTKDSISMGDALTLIDKIDAASTAKKVAKKKA
jgi:hypothetical protein